MIQILNRLEGFYGKVSSSETLMQEHYNDSQKEDEIIVHVAYGSRLESTLCKDLKQGQINITAKDTLFKSKFSTGLRSKSLRDSISDVYANIKDFQILILQRNKKGRAGKDQHRDFQQRCQSCSTPYQSTRIQHRNNKYFLKAIKRIEKIWKRNKVAKQNSQNE